MTQIKPGDYVLIRKSTDQTLPLFIKAYHNTIRIVDIVERHPRHTIEVIIKGILFYGPELTKIPAPDGVSP